MERKIIRDRQQEIESEIKALKKEWNELEKKDTLLCDDQQWFTEKEEEITISKRPKKVVKKLVGRKHWKEDFTDEHTGESITIERSQAVTINGEWI